MTPQLASPAPVTGAQGMTTVERKGLFAVWEPGSPHTRDRLVPVARTGARGFRVAGFVRLGLHAPEATADHLAFLRNAAGVGLRVSWRGSLDGIPDAPFRHLDPPRDEAGKAAWPVPPRPLLTLRRGPGFVLVEDGRDGTARQVIVDRPGWVTALVEPALGCVADADLDTETARAVRALADLGLFTAIGDHWLALPVRFRYARS